MSNPEESNQNRPSILCRFYGQGKGCRAGDECKFLHIDAENPTDNSRGRVRGRGRGSGRGGKGRNTRREQPLSLRKTQIDDLLKTPKWTAKRLQSDSGETAFAVEVAPSDPEFPFDLSCLYLALVVPAVYPPKRTSDSVLEIQLANKDVPIGVKRNIEVGFAKHVRNKTNAAIEANTPEDIPSLVEYLQWLDANLESLMQQKPAPTIKFTLFGGNREATQLVESTETGSSKRIQQQPPPSRPPVRRPVPKPLVEASEADTSDSPSSASGLNPRRAMDIKQLERRFRSSFSILKDDDDTVIQLDIVPSDPDAKSFDIYKMTSTITIPARYPSVGASLKIDGNSVLGRKGKPSTWLLASGDRENYLDHICQNFGRHVAESPDTTLLHHLNWLDRWLVSIISEPLPTDASSQRVADAVHDPDSKHAAGTENESSSKPWIKTIAIEDAELPKDMSQLDLGLENDSCSSQSDSDEYKQEDPVDNVADDGNGHFFAKPDRRGTEIRFASAEMTNISMAYCSSLNITARCGRCKDTVEIKSIIPTASISGNNTSNTAKDNQVWKACDSCATIIGIRFRPDWMFSGTSTLGYLDCSGCAPVDLLPSKLTISCEECAMKDDDNEGSTKDNSITTRIGIATTLNCQHCFKRMSVSLEEPQFVRLMSGITLGGSRDSAVQISKEVERTRMAKISKKEELARLGVVPGEPLPKNGTCKHFSRSKRWLRFPCCGKTYPCVTCHDEKEDHDHEYAQNMLCGFCAKEQRINKAEKTGQCIACGGNVIKKVDPNHPFWQGGTGVRDQKRMSRKDPRKHQGRNKTIAQKNVATPKKIK